MRWDRSVSLVLALAACEALPEVEYYGDRIELAVDFPEPVCAGTIADLDAHLDFVETVLVRERDDDPLRVYWLRDDLEPWCGDGHTGCFFPGTRVMIASEHSLTHEIVHAVVASTDSSSFLEEGLAEALSGIGVLHDPRLDTASVSQRLRAPAPNAPTEYAAAQHFVQWLGTSHPDAFPALVHAIDRHASAAAIEHTVADVFGRPFTAIQQDYVASARVHLAGARESAIQPVAWSDLHGIFAVELDCDDTDTRGPWVDDRIYRAYAVVPDVSARIRYEVDGDPEGRIDIFDPDASVADGFLTDWRVPDPVVDASATRIDVGSVADVWFEAHRPRLVVFSTAPTGGRVALVATSTPTGQ